MESLRIGVKSITTEISKRKKRKNFVNVTSINCFEDDQVEVILQYRNVSEKYFLGRTSWFRPLIVYHETY